VNRQPQFKGTTPSCDARRFGGAAQVLVLLVALVSAVLPHHAFGQSVQRLDFDGTAGDVPSGWTGTDSALLATPCLEAKRCVLVGGNLVRRFAAKPLRGQVVELTGRVRAGGLVERTGPARAYVLLRVDGADVAYEATTSGYPRLLAYVHESARTVEIEIRITEGNIVAWDFVLTVLPSESVSPVPQEITAAYGDLDTAYSGGRFEQVARVLVPAVLPSPVFLSPLQTRTGGVQLRQGAARLRLTTEVVRVIAVSKEPIASMVLLTRSVLERHSNQQTYFYDLTQVDEWVRTQMGWRLKDRPAIARHRSVPTAPPVSAGTATGAELCGVRDGRLPVGRRSASAGPTDYSTFIRPAGELSALILPVALTDAPPGEDLEDLRRPLIEEPAKWVSDTSRGRARLTVRSVDRWISLPFPSTRYEEDTSRRNNRAARQAVPDLLGDVLKEVPDVDAGAHDFVVIVAPRGSAIETRAIVRDPGRGVPHQAGEVRHAVILGGEAPGSDTMIHEMAHLFGLPDLYNPGSWQSTLKGLDLMDGTDELYVSTSGVRLTSWHLLKLGWLDGQEFRCLYQGSVSATLAPVGSLQGGLVSIVIPGGDGDEALVVELRDLSGRDVGLCQEGILIYRVRTFVNVEPFSAASDPLRSSKRAVHLCGGSVPMLGADKRTSQTAYIGDNVTIKLTAVSLGAYRVTVSREGRARRQ
jgi:M6 family metalloprotease-like protein